MTDIKHYMDLRQITEAVYDYETDTIRTEIVGGELAVNISADDDSIIAIPKTDTVAAGETKNCTGMRKVAIYIFSGSVEVLVSPLDEGDKFISLVKGTQQPGPEGEPAKPVVDIFEIAAKRIKLVCDGEAYLVLQG